MADFTYTRDGMFTALLPENDAAVRAWNELAAETDGTGKVFNHHFPQLRAALKRAGFTVKKARKVKPGELDAILDELDEVLPQHQDGDK